MEGPSLQIQLHTHEYVVSLFNYYCLLLYVDIDECLQGTTGCNQDCRNTEGSFVCTCHNGYQLHRNDLTLCVGMLSSHYNYK